MNLKKMLRLVKFRSGMSPCSEYLDMVHSVIDGEATEQEEVYLRRHLKICLHCLEKFNIDQELKNILQLKLAHREVPEGLVEAIKTKISKSA